MEPQDYWIELNLRLNGTELRFTGPEKKLKDVDALTIVRPGYSYGRDINLSDYFNIKKVGDYSLKVTYGIGPDLKEIEHGKCIEYFNFHIK